MRIHLKIAGIFGFLGVSAGAFGAHALKDMLNERAMTQTWQTAVLYTLIHTCSLLIIGLLDGINSSRWINRAGHCWMIGVLLFSGSLYGLALGGPRFLGPITPLGGLFLLAGWLCVFVAAMKAKTNEAV
jgi:uncharacterized membrane protein YgdD (TMEM256/DUF423 family)